MTSQVTILSGSIVRVWAVLEQVLKRHEFELSKADRAMRIIRVDMGDAAGVLVGVRYKESLLGEVRSWRRGARACCHPGKCAVLFPLFPFDCLHLQGHL